MPGKSNHKYSSNKSLFILLLFFVFLLSGCKARRYKYAFLDPSLKTEARVNDLISRLTIDEKISQLSYNSPAIDRLGIPKYNWWNECLHGVARAGKATVFPQPIGLAATWDNELIYRVADAISDEARAKHHQFLRLNKRNIYQGLTFWSPNINIFRDPRWGRGMETYGEDPFLTGKMAVSFIQGLQGNDPNYFKVIATAKHYVVHSGPEPLRHAFNAQVSENDFRNTYLVAFKMAVEDANVQSVMCAYNRVNNGACCGSEILLNDILRNELGFKGYVVSDCGAIADIFNGHKLVKNEPEAAALALKSGTDLNCGEMYHFLIEGFKAGLVKEDDINRALARLLTARFKLGMFDPPENVVYSQIPFEIVESGKHRKLALEAARKSIVLLRNENELLPLGKNLKRIAVIGPNADDIDVLNGNYYGYASQIITPLQGIKNKTANTTEVIYARGCEWAPNTPYFDIVPDSVFFQDESCNSPGLTTEYFSNIELKGDPVAIRIEKNINVCWWDGYPLPDLEDDNFSVRWSGYLRAPVTGEYLLGGEGFNQFSIFLEDSLLISFKHIHHERKVYQKVWFDAGKSYKLKIEFANFLNDAFMKLIWTPPQKKLEQEAINAVKKSDAAIMFLGLSPRLEGEEMSVTVPGFSNGDRTTLDLPEIQENLLKKIAALGKPVILVLLNGSALSINWANEHIPAIIEAWYPGQLGGEAIADVIFGDYNPAGRLPVTFYKSVSQLPPFEDYSMAGRTYRYFKGDVLYPFGYGLSYSRFEYGEISTNKTQLLAGDTLQIKISVKNSGKFDGEEVVQLYITPPPTGLENVIKELKGFQRVFIPSGATKEIIFSITGKDLKSFNEITHTYSVEPGEYLIGIGGSSEVRSIGRFTWLN
jgi:beta-glucosidase